VPTLILGGAVLSVLGAFGYSYWAYRQDPHPLPPTASLAGGETRDTPLSRAARRR
jgi:hypothetical protein